MEKPLTERDLEVLSCLRPGYRDDPISWLTPLDVGGGNGSHHNATLNKLAGRGLVEFKQRGAGDDRIGLRPTWRGRGSKCYRITAAGLAFLAERGGKWMTRAEGEVHYQELIVQNRRNKAIRAAMGVK